VGRGERAVANVLDEDGKIKTNADGTVSVT
jgi:hypothetical protein